MNRLNNQCVNCANLNPHEMCNLNLSNLRRNLLLKF